MYKKNMGKILTNALCIGLAAAMITGCGTTKAEDARQVMAESGASVEEDDASAREVSISNVETSKESEKVSDTDNFSTSDESNKDGKVEDTDASLENIEVRAHKAEYESDNRVFLKYKGHNNSGEHIFCVDTDGKIIGKYSEEDIEEILDENDTFYSPMSFLLEKDGILYYECWQAYYYPSMNSDAVYAIDPVNGKVTKVIEFEDGIVKFDYYDGSFFAEHYYESDRNKSELYKIEKAKDSLSYSVGECQIIDNYRGRTDNSGECYERILGENGYIVLDDGTGYYIRDLKGNKTRLGANCTGTAVPLTYDPQFVFFVTQESTYNITGMYMYDVEKKRTDKLPINTTNLAYDVIYQDGILYYSTIDSEEQGIYTLYSYNVETRDKQIIAKDQTGSFTRSYGPLYYDSIENGKIFMRDDKDDAANWYYADLKDIEGTRTLLDLEAVLAAFPAKEDSIAKYGKVENLSGVARCPHCNKVVYEVDADTFILEAAYSKQADKINAVLRERAKQRTTINISGTDISKENCQNMHGDAMYTSDDHYCIYDVHIVNDRYLAISEKVELHSTDAPSGWENRQFLFDLQTGSELNIMSFYSGTEEELKKLLANKVVEHFKERYGEVSKPFSEEDAKTTYNKAYELVKIDAIFFNEGEIMCYFDNNFYDSPYMTDYFRIRVSYQELLGRDRL